MKKSFVYFAASVLALSACTSEEVLNESVQSNAIGFENVVSKQSRGDYEGDLTSDNLDKFYVYSYYTPKGLDNHPFQVFGGEEVTLDKTAGTWGYSGTRYWVPDATYYFYAYSCNDVELDNDYGTPSMDVTDPDATSISDRALTIKNYVCDTRHQHDLLYAEKENIVAKSKSADLNVVANAKVGFNFRHILTKVNAEFSTDFANDYEIIVSNVKLVNVMNIGTYNPTAKATEGMARAAVWYDVKRSHDNAVVNLVVDPANNVVSSAATEGETKGVATNAGVVMPYLYKTNNGGAVQLKFNIVINRKNVEGGVDTILSRTLVGTWSPEWESGYSYTYNILISGTATDLDPIVFETKENMNVGGWTPGTAASINFSTTTTN